jgi:hypothetical protein
VDAILNQRWQGGLSPFDGDCLRADDLISVADLGSLLAAIVPALQRDYASQELYTFDDWHQHDGYVTERRGTEWASLSGAAQSRATLIASRQGDTYVHRSFYPEDLSFLLRYDIADEECGDETGFSGMIDLSANSALIAKVFQLFPLTLRSRFQVQRSKDYFDKTYSG